MCWFHSLCKNIDLERDTSGRPRIYDPVVGSKKQHSQGNQSWLRCGVFLKQQNSSASFPSTSSVTLVIFSASGRLQRVFASLQDHPGWQDVLEDPFGLFSIILEEFYLGLDESIDKVRQVLGFIERVRLSAQVNSSKLTIQDALDLAGKATDRAQYDFVGAHNVAKHIQFLKESSSAVLAIAKRLGEHHRTRIEQCKVESKRENMRAVHELLLHKLTLTEGCMLRVTGMESRIQNVINLVRFTLIPAGDRSKLIL